MPWGLLQYYFVHLLKKIQTMTYVVASILRLVSFVRSWYHESFWLSFLLVNLGGINIVVPGTVPGVVAAKFNFKSLAS